MIVVKGDMKLADGGGFRLKSAIDAITAATRAEAGCQHYSLTPDADDPDLLRVYEEWETQGALSLHLIADHMIDFQVAMRRTRILRADVNIHYPDGTVKRLINV